VWYRRASTFLKPIDIDNEIDYDSIDLQGKTMLRSIFKDSEKMKYLFSMKD
jgi:hypothetical protein